MRQYNDKEKIKVDMVWILVKCGAATYESYLVFKHWAHFRTKLGYNEFIRSFE